MSSKNKLRPTMADVAERAQVSIKSISRVVRGEEGVSPETRQRILDVMQEIGFAANASARKLRGVATTISLVAPGLTMADYVGQVVQGIFNSPHVLRYNISLHVQNQSAAQMDEQYFRSLVSSGMTDGFLLIVPFDYDMLIEVCREYGVPFVTVDYEGELDLSNDYVISSTNRKGVMDAVLYLMALGHQRVHFMTGMMHMESARERLEGYKDALASVGMPFDPSLVLPGDWSQRLGFQLTHDLFQRGDVPTAIIASNDMMAFGVMEAVKEAGLRVGEQVSVIGVDDIPAASQSFPALTTIRQPMQAMGEAALDILVALLEDRPVPSAQRVFNTELVIRQSTGKSPK